MKPKIVAVALLVAVALTLTPAVRADTYVQEEEGHPLRYIAYIAFPVGVAAEYLVLRPWHKIVSREPYATIFGHDVLEGDRFPGWSGRKVVHNEDAYRTLYRGLTPEEVEARKAAKAARKEREASE